MKILLSRSALRPHVCVSAQQRLWDQVYSELTWHHHQHIHSKVKQPQSGPNNCHVPRQKRTQSMRTLLDFTSWMRTGSRRRDLQAPQRGPALSPWALVPRFKLPKPCRKKHTPIPVSPRVGRGPWWLRGRRLKVDLPAERKKQTLFAEWVYSNSNHQMLQLFYFILIGDIMSA